MSALRQVWTIASRDIAAEMHTHEIVSSLAVYVVLALLAFGFALDLSGPLARLAAPGVLWVTVTFAGMLGLQRSLAREGEQRAMDGLLMAPVDRAVIYLGKALGNLLLILVVEALALPLASGLLGVNLLRGDVLLVTLLGTVGYVAAGTLLAAVAASTRAQAVALPILLLPLQVPGLLSAVQATAGLLEGGTLADVSGWVQLLVTYDLVVTAVAMVTFEFVVED